jgi:hypothetical protein
LTTPSGTIASASQDAWADVRFRRQAIFTLAALVVVLAGLARFLERNEARQGVILPDPVLALYAPHDVTWLTFALIYMGLITAILYLARHPATLLLAMQSYSVMVVFRIIAMTLVPLEPPVTMISLQDPLVEIFGTGRLLTKDLFFSGHTSTLFLLYLVAPESRLKQVFLGCTIAVACCVLVQHVHYSIDVFVAPFFAYAAFHSVRALQARAGMVRSQNS